MKKKIYPTKTYFIFLILLFTPSCLTSLVRVTPIDGFDLNEIKDKIKRDQIKDYKLLRLDSVCDETLDYKECSRLKKDFTELRKIKFENQAPIQLRIKYLEPPKSSRLLYYGDALIYLTLGLFPLIDQNTMKVRLDLFSKSDKVIVKSFSYNVEQMKYRGFIAPFIRIFAAPIADAGYYEDVSFADSSNSTSEFFAKKVYSELQLLANDPENSFDLEAYKKFPEKPVLVVLGQNLISMKEQIESRIRNYGIPTAEKTEKGLSLTYEVFTDEYRNYFYEQNKLLKLGIYTLIKIESDSNFPKKTNVQIVDVESGRILESFTSKFERSRDSLENENDYYYNNLALEIIRTIKTKSY